MILVAKTLCWRGREGGSRTADMQVGDALKAATSEEVALRDDISKYDGSIPVVQHAELTQRATKLREASAALAVTSGGNLEGLHAILADRVAELCDRLASAAPADPEMPPLEETAPAPAAAPAETKPAPAAAAPTAKPAAKSRMAEMRKAALKRYAAVEIPSEVYNELASGALSAPKTSLPGEPTEPYGEGWDSSNPVRDATGAAIKEEYWLKCNRIVEQSKKDKYARDIRVGADGAVYAQDDTAGEF